MVEAVAVDSQGNLFIADTGNHRIRKVSPSGIIVTIAGTGVAGYSGNGGPATNAKLNTPRDVAVDSQGNVFIADLENHRIRKVNASGTITVVAGNGTVGDAGDGGPATSAQVAYPLGVAVDTQGNLFIVSWGRIRKVDTSGTITTVAGTNALGFNGDGQAATSAWLDPMRVAVDQQGTIFISDHYNDRIRKVGADGLIWTIAGDGSSGAGGDGGPAVRAQVFEPMGIATDAPGTKVFIAGRWSNRVRRVRIPTPGSVDLTLTTP